MEQRFTPSRVSAMDTTLFTLGPSLETLNMLRMLARNYQPKSQIKRALTSCSLH